MLTIQNSNLFTSYYAFLPKVGPSYKPVIWDGLYKVIIFYFRLLDSTFLVKSPCAIPEKFMFRANKNLQYTALDYGLIRILFKICRVIRNYVHRLFNEQFS